jgi:hypothetical protein
MKIRSAVFELLNADRCGEANKRISCNF